MNKNDYKSTERATMYNVQVVNKKHQKPEEEEVRKKKKKNTTAHNPYPNPSPS